MEAIQSVIFGGSAAECVIDSLVSASDDNRESKVRCQFSLRLCTYQLLRFFVFVL
jgi:hypothetical protein